MKKVILFAAILFAGVSVAKAADPVVSGTINLKVNLSPFQSIVIGGEITEGGFNGEDVVLDYVTMDNYEDGVSTTINNHIVVRAAGKYSVTVKNNNATTEGFDFNTISILAEGADGAASGDDLTLSNVSLTTVEQTLIASKKGTSGGASYNIKYTGSDKNKYGNLVKNGVKTTYETEVLYTVTAN